MAREHFYTDKTYAGRLYSIHRRPIENQDLKVCLVRLEFEVFLIDPDKKELRSLGKIASRDIIVTAGVAQDPGVSPYVRGLSVPNPNTPEGWENCIRQRPWIGIEFASPNSQDERNPFKSVSPFDATDHNVVEYDYRVGEKWVTLGVAAQELDCSVSKMRRVVDDLEREWSHRLVRRTQGNQRRVNLRLLKDLWEW